VDHEVSDTARVAPLVVIPRDELDKGGIQPDAGLGIKGGGDGP